MNDELLEVRRTVDTTLERLFALLADPTRHQEIDTSGMVRAVHSKAGRLTGIGDQFDMRMYNDRLGDYVMRNTVIAYIENRLIGWGPELYPLDGHTATIGDMRATGHTYTWALEPASPATVVTVTYNWSQVTDERFKRGFPLLSPQQLDESINRAAHAAA